MKAQSLLLLELLFFGGLLQFTYSGETATQECQNLDYIEQRLLDAHLGGFVSVDVEGEGSKELYIGYPQEIPDDFDRHPEFMQRFFDVIEETSKYMKKLYTMTIEEYILPFPEVCQNLHPACAAWAAMGACDSGYDNADIVEMVMIYCAPACQLCDQLLPTLESCTPDRDTNIFKPGDLNAMFERIVGEISYEDGVVVPTFYPRIISRPNRPLDVDESESKEDYYLGPWIVALEDFLTEEECDRLITWGETSNYERSTMQDEEDVDGESAWRTSVNTWCNEKCSEDAIVKRVIEKISNTTGIPEENSEYLQLVKYTPNQFYKNHSDFVYDIVDEYNGPRILTFFLYLNNVEEGGATQFGDITLGTDDIENKNGERPISIDVLPKKGMALVWPSVLDDDLDEIDDRTYHSALPVIKGMKYGANAWLHLRKHKTVDPCDYDALDELRETYDEGEFNDEDEDNETENSSDDDEDENEDDDTENSSDDD